MDAVDQARESLALVSQVAYQRPGIVIGQKVEHRSGTPGQGAYRRPYATAPGQT